jgi:hypothetical protein
MKENGETIEGWKLNWGIKFSESSIYYRAYSNAYLKEIKDE